MNTVGLKRKSFDIFKKGHKLFIEGHRGVNRECYQNSIQSFSKAIEYELDSIELDIWLTKDKIPIILHGGDQGQLYDHIEDKIDKKLTANDLTLEELQKLRLKGEKIQKIPKFSEILDLCKDKIFINIEIKDPNINETFKEVITLIEEKKMISQIAISSFHHEYYDLISKYNNEHDEKIEFGFLYFDTTEKDKLIRPINYNYKNCSMNIYQKDITKKIVDKAHEHGMAVLVWFKMKDDESVELYKKLFDYGIDAMCCNEPKKAKEFRDNVYFQNK